MTRPSTGWKARLAGAWAYHRQQVSALGWLGWAVLQLHLRFPSLRKLTGHRLWTKAARFPVRYRPDESDLTVFWSVFLESEYGCVDTTDRDGLVIDCGANVGYSAAYFLTRFPSSCVVAVEPNEENFALLVENTRRYGDRVLPIRSGVWSHPCELVVSPEPYRDGQAWSCQVREARPGEGDTMRAVDVPTLLRLSGRDRVWILKVDIERAEMVVFDPNCQRWLHLCDTIVAELHDEECKRVFYSAMEPHPFSIREENGLTVCHRLSENRPSALKATLAYSVVIVTYKRHLPLADTLRALAPLIDPEQGEVLVIDQLPAGPLPPDVVACPGLRYIVLDRPGMVNARNVGLAEARGEVVLFVDDDVIPTPGLIPGHIAAYADPKVGGVAGGVFAPGQTEPVPTDPRSFDLAEGWRHIHFDHDTPGDVCTSRGCNMSFRRDLLRKVGGFDDHIEIFRDDSDACFRVTEAGYVIRFVPSARLVHLDAPSGGTRGTTSGGVVERELRMYRQLYRHYRDNLYFLVRHFHGRQRRRLIAEAYRAYVGVSRWPWRLLAKNAIFAAALLRARSMAHRRSQALVNRPGGG